MFSNIKLFTHITFCGLDFVSSMSPFIFLLMPKDLILTISKQFPPEAMVHLHTLKYVVVY